MKTRATLVLSAKSALPSAPGYGEQCLPPTTKSETDTWYAWSASDVDLGEAPGCCCDESVKTRASFACKRKSNLELVRSGASTLGVPFHSRAPVGRGGPAKSVFAPHGLASHDRRDYYKFHYCTPAAASLSEASRAYIDALHNDDLKQGPLIQSRRSTSCRLVSDDRQSRPSTPSLFSETRNMLMHPPDEIPSLAVHSRVPGRQSLGSRPNVCFNPREYRHILRLIMRVSLTTSSARLVAHDKSNVFRAWPVGRTDTYSHLLPETTPWIFFPRLRPIVPLT